MEYHGKRILLAIGLEGQAEDKAERLERRVMAMMGKLVESVNTGKRARK